MRNNFTPPIGRWILLLAVFSLVFPSLTSAALIQSDLHLGDDNLEVKVLQILLNFDPTTRVSLIGAGSWGRETTYFGNRTRSALIKFQKKNKIYSEAGWVGPITRVKIDNWLNELIARLNALKPVASPTVNLSVTPITPVAPTVSPVVSSLPVITSISPTSGGNQTMITIKGKGFLPTGNTVMTTYGDSVTNLASADGQTLSFVFVFPAEVFRDEDNGGAISYPGNLKLSVNVWVITKNGRSNYLTYDLQI